MNNQNVPNNSEEPILIPIKEKKNNSGLLIIAIVLIILIVIFVVGYVVGKNMIDEENTNVITDSSTEKIEKNENINYMDFNLLTPSGYSGELLEDGGVLFKSSDKVFSVDFYEGTISDLDSALLEMGATSKGIKDVDKVSFTLYSYKKSGKSILIYVADTGRFRICGYIVNSSYEYKFNEKILSDVVVCLGGKDNMSSVTISETPRTKFNTKFYTTIYSFEK